MAERQKSRKNGVPEPKSIPEIEVGVVDSVDQEPVVDTLRAARSLLLSEYGPCAANQTELLVATARRLQRDADQAS